jgi:hypothetical protein
MSWPHAACLFFIMLLAALGGCVVPPPLTPAPPPYQFQPGTLRAIDERIYEDSVQARHEAEAYARVAMDEWLWRVRQRIEEDFIPWYSGYGIQQWIAAKIVAFKLLYTEGEATPEERLVSYLQEQFYEQVLEPVSGFVDPQTVMKDAGVNYLRELGKRLDRLPSAYDVPAAAISEHLESVKAIVVQGVPPQRASLYAVLHADDLYDLPAYQALLGNVEAVSAATNPTPSADRLRVVANQAVSRLLDSVALRGGMATASTVVGGYWGMAITAGSAAFGAAEHEQEKAALEAQLRENLDAAMNILWQELVEDPRDGVTALVHQLSDEIEESVVQPFPWPLSGSGYPVAPRF